MLHNRNHGALLAGLAGKLPHLSSYQDHRAYLIASSFYRYWTTYTLMLKKLLDLINSPAPTHTAALVGLDNCIEVPPQTTLLQAALNAGVDFPHHCTVGTCGTCRCRLTNGRVRPVLDFSYTLSAEELRQGYILACQAMLKTDVTVEVESTAVPSHPLENYSGSIVATSAPTTSILEVTVRLDRPIIYTAGQFADITIAGIQRPRSYSFAKPCPADGTNEIHFHIRHVQGGAFTEWLFESDRIGENIAVRGPRGSFWLRPADAPIICVAGGTGMAPILALLGDAEQRTVTRPVNFLYGARTRADLYAVAQIEDMAVRWPNTFQFVPVLSDEPDNSSWKGPRGLVSDFLETNSSTSAQSHYYLCGPPAMIDAALVHLNRVAVPTEQIHYDKFLDARQLDTSPVITDVDSFGGTCQ